ncbi:hypothetical protein CFC21_106897 [Triticum aestivum]|uniref:Uncharacterized protein n=2 Tax=Triticum aestivum TaxID=4565 RepID=A0A9R1MFS5_WHEAT|nr:uncharacterized protein LOC123168061 [Triticum aestivum]KAF7106143.1 hypothetical protein CFC21_106897 [Triticum aestivum]
MGKKPGNAGPSSASRPMNQAMSLREETSGKAQADVPSLLRVQHLQRLAAWVSGEAGVGSIGALLGHRLATNAEASGIPIEASTFLCQRCESILQPGFNCTIRIKNNKKKSKRRKKSNPGQNSVVYACHFCGDQNLIRGSGKGIVKGLLASRKPVSTMLKGENMNVPTVTTKTGKQGNGPKSNLPEDYKMEKGAVFSMVDCGQLAAAHEDILQKIEVESPHDKCVSGIEPAASKNTTTCEPDVTSQAEFLAGSNFVTPRKSKLAEVTVPIGSAEPSKTRSTLNNKAKNCGSVAGKTPGSYSKSASNKKSAPGDSTQPAGSSRKRARKGWTTLKQIAEKDELERKEKMDNFVIPFFMQ